MDFTPFSVEVMGGNVVPLPLNAFLACIRQFTTTATTTITTTTATAT